MSNDSMTTGVSAMELSGAVLAIKTAILQSQGRSGRDGVQPANRPTESGLGGMAHPVEGKSREIRLRRKGPGSATRWSRRYSPIPVPPSRAFSSTLPTGSTRRPSSPRL